MSHTRLSDYGLFSRQGGWRWHQEHATTTTADVGLGLRNILSHSYSRGLALWGLLGDRVVGSSARWGAATGIVRAGGGIYHRGVLHVACQTALIFGCLGAVCEHGD